MIVRHEVILDDKVTPAAKSAAASVQSLSSGMTSMSKSMGSATPAAKSFGDTMSKHAFDASNAMQVGQQVIGGAVAGIKGALVSLASGDVQGAISSLGDGIAGAAKALDLLVPGLGEVASALIKVQFAALGMVAAGAKMAIEATQAKTQMVSMFDALGEGKFSGGQVVDMLESMRGKLGQTKETMAPLVKQFMAMGVTSEDALERMTTAALSAKALTGGSDAAAEAFTKLSKKIQTAAETGQALKIPLKGLGSLADMGLTVDDVATKMGISSAKLAAQLKSGSVDAKKFGDALQGALIDKGAGPLQKMSGGLANLGALAKEYLVDMFEDMGPAIEPFLSAVKDLFSIFDSKSKPSGQALKSGIQAFFTNVFTQATKVVPMIKHFLLDVIIFGLKAYIALKPMIAWFVSLKQNEKVMAVVQKAFEGLKVAAIAIGIVIAVVVGILFVLWAISVGIGLAIWTLAGIIIDFTGKAGQTLYEWAASAVDIAGNFIQGLVNGISNGTGMIIDAVKALGGSAVNALKKTLGIASPSKVMMAMGGHTASGFAEGIEASAPAAAGAAAGMAGSAVAGAGASGGSMAGAAAAPSSGGSAGAPASGSSGGVTVTVEAGAILIQGAGKAAEEITEEMISLVWERIALQGGL